MERGGRLLGELMVEMGLIDGEDLRKALALQEVGGGLLGDILIEMGSMGEEALRWAIARQLDIPLIHPDPKALDPDALALISPERCRRYAVLPISLLPEDDDPAPVLILAAADPADGAVLEDIRHSISHRIRIVAALREEINRCLDKLYGEVAIPPDMDDLGVDYHSVKTDPTGLKLLGRLIEKMLTARQKTLRLFLAEGRTFARDGDGNELFMGRTEWLPILLERSRKLAGLEEARQGVGQRGRMWYRTLLGEKVLLRVVILGAMGGEELHLRAILQENQDRTLEDLGLDHGQVEKVRACLKKPGLVLVSAPGGEGLISTLYTLMRAVGPGGMGIALEEEVVYRSADAVQLEVSSGTEVVELLRDLKYMEFDRVLLGRAGREKLGDLLALARRGKWVFAGIEEGSLTDLMEALAEEGGRGPLLGLKLCIHQRLTTSDGKPNSLEARFEVVCAEERLLKELKTSGLSSEYVKGIIVSAASVPCG